MKFKIFSLRRCLVLLGVFAICFAFSDAFGALDGRWIQHPAAALRAPKKEGQVDRIIEGNRYVYFSVRGIYYNNNTTGGETNSFANRNKFDPLQLFIYDKSQPFTAENFKPLAQEYELSGVLPLAMNYSPALGLFVVVYENNRLDMIYDDGRIVSSSALYDLSIPTSSLKPYTVTFDEERDVMYLAGSFGYATLSLKDGSLEDYLIPGKAISWAGRVGDHMVVFAGDMSPRSYNTQTYVFPVNEKPSALTTPIADGANLQSLMPISENKFAALAPNGTNDKENILKLFSIGSGGGVTSQVVESGLTVDDGATLKFRHMFRTDGYTQASKEGYVIHSTNNILFVKKGTSLSDLVTKLSKASLSATEKAAKAGTMDGSRVWIYKYENDGLSDASPRGFYTFDVDGTNWVKNNDLLTPSAPTSAYPAYGGWNPKYGLILRGPGTLFNTQDDDADRLMAYKDGKWTDLSFAAHNPAYYEVSKMSNEVGIDPINPDWIWGNPHFYGLDRIDLSNYDNFLELGTKSHSDKVAQYPGYFDVFPTNTSSWSSISRFTPVAFDSEGTMWFARYIITYDGTNANEILKSYTPLYYLTAKEREAIANIGSDASRIPDLMAREIVVPQTVLSHSPRMIALRSPGNENILLVSHKHYRGDVMKSFFYDHNGTPGDTSDDRYTFFRELYDENNDLISYMNEFNLYEDMATGKVWICTHSGPYILDPQEILAGGNHCKRLKIEKADGVYVEGNLLEQLIINNITDDNLGRKWLASEEGLYCLSPDATEILAHFTVENSRIPSDNVFNVICNPENGSLFVLTDRGIAEFHPEGSTTSVAPGNHLAIWPTTITPSYNGYVNISGAEEGGEYVVCDKNGDEVMALDTPVSGKIQWNTLDAKGEKMSPGRYNIKRKGTEESHPILIVE